MKDMHTLPGPPPVKTIIQAIRMLKEINSRSLDLINGWIAEYGRNIKLEILGETQLLITEPEMMREVLVTKANKFVKPRDYTSKERGLARFLGNGLVTSDGEFWKRQHKLVQPALHVKRIQAYADVMGQFTEEAIATWDDGAHLDIAHEMMRLTLRIVAQTLFSTSVDADVDAFDKAMKAANNIAGQYSILPTWIPTPAELSARKALQGLDNVVYALIADWRQRGEDSGDLLSMLMLARDDENVGMTDKQIRDEAVTLFSAGHDTTANALSWTFKLLSENPEAAAKLHAELDAVLGGRTPTLADLPNLPYTEMVIKESMRLHPPAANAGRLALEDVQIGDYLIKKGTSVLLFWYATHRHAAHWENPLAFQPERFSKANESNINRYAYLPFGAGPRVCVGNLFAMMEAQILLATIAQKFKLELKPGHEVIAVNRVVTFPKGGLPMIVRERVPQYDEQVAARVPTP